MGHQQVFFQPWLCPWQSRGGTLCRSCCLLLPSEQNHRLDFGLCLQALSCAGRVLDGQPQPGQRGRVVRAHAPHCLPAVWGSGKRKQCPGSLGWGGGLASPGTPSSLVPVRAGPAAGSGPGMPGGCPRTRAPTPPAAALPWLLRCWPRGCGPHLAAWQPLPGPPQPTGSPCPLGWQLGFCRWEKPVHDPGQGGSHRNPGRTWCHEDPLSGCCRAGSTA